MTALNYNYVSGFRGSLERGFRVDASEQGRGFIELGIGEVVVHLEAEQIEPFLKAVAEEAGWSVGTKRLVGRNMLRLIEPKPDPVPLDTVALKVYGSLYKDLNAEGRVAVNWIVHNQ